MGNFGKQGILKLVNKKDVYIPEEYQRELDNKHVKKIKENFDWVKFGPVTIGERDDKKYYLIDGQHRVKAVETLEEIEFIPCIIHKSSGPQYEAKVFYELNTSDRKTLSAKGVFKAQIQYDKEAKELNELLQQTNDVKYERSLKVLYSLYWQDPDAFCRIWPLVKAIFKGRATDTHTIRGMFYVETHAKGWSLSNKDVIEVLSSETFPKIKYEVELATVGGKPSAPYWGKGILNIINTKKPELKLGDW